MTTLLIGIFVAMLILLAVTMWIWPNKLPDKEAAPDAVVNFIREFVQASGAQEREQIVEEYILSPAMLPDDSEGLSNDYYILESVLRCEADNVYDVQILDSGEHYVKFAMLDRDARLTQGAVFFFYTLNVDGKTILRYTVAGSKDLSPVTSSDGGNAL